MECEQGNFISIFLLPVDVEFMRSEYGYLTWEDWLLTTLTNPWNL